MVQYEKEILTTRPYGHQACDACKDSQDFCLFVWRVCSKFAGRFDIQLRTNRTAISSRISNLFP